LLLFITRLSLASELKFFQTDLDGFYKFIHNDIFSIFHLVNEWVIYRNRLEWFFTPLCIIFTNLPHEVPVRPKHSLVFGFQKNNFTASFLDSFCGFRKYWYWRSFTSWWWYIFPIFINPYNRLDNFRLLLTSRLSLTIFTMRLM
jgi:hypothetical protein